MKKITQILTVTTVAFFILTSFANADSGDYVYKQKFMPRQTVEIDLSKTALFVTDPQNDFLSEKSPAWGLVGPTVTRNKVVEKEKMLKALGKELGIPLFYSTHMYTPKDFEQWPKKPLNGIDKVMFDNKMFAQGTFGHEIHKDLKPDSNTIVMNPHKGLSNFWTGDAAIQLRMYGVETIIMYGMSANMCVESHARDAIENGFELIIIADATAAAGDAAYEAALTNYEFLAMEVVTTEQIVKRLKAAKRGE
ncbi:MAG: cysteine hydrolase [Desulfobacterales bacterium]|nr:cysteine hydrolase [Desulfobacterales bacterium]